MNRPGSGPAGRASLGAALRASARRTGSGRAARPASRGPPTRGPRRTARGRAPRGCRSRTARAPRAATKTTTILASQAPMMTAVMCRGRRVHGAQHRDDRGPREDQRERRRRSARPRPPAARRRGRRRRRRPRRGRRAARACRAARGGTPRGGGLGQRGGLAGVVIERSPGSSERAGLLAAGRPRSGPRVSRVATSTTPTPSGDSTIVVDQRTSAATPKAKTAVQTYMMTTARRCECPSASSRWCRCMRSGWNGDLPGADAPDDGQPHVEQRQQQHRERQQHRQERGEPLRARSTCSGSICPVTTIAAAENTKPSSIAPESPMKMRAG